jgi:hypothetical protein
MRVPYSVFKGTRAGGVKVYARRVKRATHFPGSGPSLPEVTNDPVPFGPGSVRSERRRGTQSGHGNLGEGMGWGDIWME